MVEMVKRAELQTNLSIPSYTTDMWLSDSGPDIKLCWLNSFSFTQLIFKNATRLLCTFLHYKYTEPLQPPGKYTFITMYRQLELYVIIVGFTADYGRGILVAVRSEVLFHNPILKSEGKVFIHFDRVCLKYKVTLKKLHTSQSKTNNSDGKM